MSPLRAMIRGKTPLHEEFLRVYRYEFEVEMHRGGSQRISREVMERGNAVAVLGHDPQHDEIVLAIEQEPTRHVPRRTATVASLPPAPQLSLVQCASYPRLRGTAPAHPVGQAFLPMCVGVRFC